MQNNANPADALNKNALDKFNVVHKQPYNIEDDIVVNKENENATNFPGGLPPRTPNYGKTPKYIAQYKEEAKQKEDARMEAKAARNRPPGTKIMPEGERIKTLENLKKNKEEINRVLHRLPISLRTMSLKQQKVDLENKL